MTFTEANLILELFSQGWRYGCENPLTNQIHYWTYQPNRRTFHLERFDTVCGAPLPDEEITEADFLSHLQSRWTFTEFRSEMYLSSDPPNAES